MVSSILHVHARFDLQSLPKVSWEWVSCGLPNFSSGIFDSTIFESTNSFNSLSQDSINENEVSFNYPTATSSPIRTQLKRGSNYRRGSAQPLRVVSLDCQPIKTPGKKAILQNMIEAANADIIIGTELWLNKDIASPEVFPAHFRYYRKDRVSERQGGGVFIFISENISSEEPEELRV